MESPLSFSKAVEGDLALVRALDSEAFPQGDTNLEPSSDGEIEAGISKGELWLARDVEGVVLAYAQCESLAPNSFNLISLAVIPSAQNQSVGRRLLEHLIATVEHVSPEAEITCVTSPKNERMIRLLLSKGFKGVEYLKDYFGPGKDRIWFRKCIENLEYRSNSQVTVLAEQSDAYSDLMQTRGMHLVDTWPGSQGKLLTLAQPVQVDSVSLRQTEANTSVAQASAILAALAFLVTILFQMAKESAASPVGVLLIISLVLTIGATQVYANSTGNMARIGDGNFDKHMKWGNLLLDFGGHYPLVILLPALFSRIGGETGWLATLLGFAVGLLILAYELSPFSIFRRHKFSWIGFALVLLTAGLPAFTWLIALPGPFEAIWVGAVLAVLSLRFAWQARGRNVERRQIKK